MTPRCFASNRLYQQDQVECEVSQASSPYETTKGPYEHRTGPNLCRYTGDEHDGVLPTTVLILERLQHQRRPRSTAVALWRYTIDETTSGGTQL